jgi:hypothetical protein
MPTFRHGRGSKVLYGGYDLSNQFREANINSQADTADTTAFGSSVKTYVMGMIGGTAALSGMYSGAAGDEDAVLSAAFGQETPTPVTIGFDSGLAIGRRIAAAQVHQSSYQISGSISDMVAVSADLQATGGFMPGVSLLDSATTVNTMATANGTSVDQGATGAPWTANCYANLHVVTNSLVNTGTFTFAVQHSSDDSTFADLLTFTGFTTATGVFAQHVRSSGAVTINRYIRARWVYAATLTGSFNAHVSFVRLAQ